MMRLLTCDILPANSIANDRTTADKSPYTKRVEFYWDPEYTDLLVKQIQQLKEKNCFGPNQKAAAKVLYNLKNPLKFESPKSGNVFWSLRDTYLRDMKNTELFEFYQSGLKEIDDKIGFSSMIPVPSRIYSI
jgi:hypothetical protein